MNTRTKKILAVVLVTPVMAVAGLYIFRNSIVKQVAESQIQKAFPGSKAHIGSLEIGLFGPIFEMNDLEVKKENEVLLLVKKSHASLSDKVITITVHDIVVKVDPLVKLMPPSESKNKEDKKEERSSETSSSDNLDSLRGYKLNVDLKNIAVDAQGMLFTLEDFKIEGASIDSAFKLQGNYSLKEAHGQAQIKQSGDFDFSNYLATKAFKASLRTEGTGRFKEKSLPPFSSLITASVDFQKMALIDLSFKMQKTELVTSVEYNFADESINAKTINAQIYPEESLQYLALGKNSFSMNKDALLSISGFFNLGPKELKTDIALNSTMMTLTRPGEKDIMMAPITASITGESDRSKPSVIKSEFKYKKSFLSVDVGLKEVTPTSVDLAGAIINQDLIDFVEAMSPDLKFGKNEARLDLKGHVNLENEMKVYDFKMEASQFLTVTNAEGHTLAIDEIQLSANSLEGQHQVKGQVLLGVTPLGQKKTQFISNVEGLLLDPSAQKGQDKIGDLSFKLQSKSSDPKNTSPSSHADAQIELNKNSFKMQKLLGVFYLRDILPVAPKSLRDMLNVSTLGDTNFNVEGNLEFKDNKITHSKFKSSLSQPLKLMKDNYQITLSELKLNSLPPKDSSILPWEFLTSLTAFDKIKKATVSVNHVSSLNLDLDQMVTKKNLKLSSTHKTKINKLSGMDFSFSMDDKTMILSDLSFILNPLDFIEFMPKDSQGSVKPNSEFIVSGGFTAVGTSMQKLDLTVKTKSPISLDLHPKVKSTIEMNGHLTRLSSDFSMKVSMLKGETTFKSQGLGVQKLDDLSMAHLFPKHLKLKSQGMVFTKPLLREIMYKESPPGVTSSKTASPQAAAGPQGSLYDTLKDIPPFTAELEKSTFLVDSHTFVSEGKFIFGRNSFESKNFQVSSEGGVAGFEVSGLMNPKVIQVSMSSKIKQFEMDSFSGFFPPIVETVTGKLNGDLSAKGSLIPNKKPTYKADFNFNFLNGELKRLNISEKIQAIVKKIDFTGKLYEKAGLVLSDKFDKLILQGSADETLIQMKKFEFQGIKNSILMVGEGYVGQIGSKKASKLTFKFSDLSGKFGPFLKEAAGLDSLPIVLSGTEIDLSPDYGYTLKVAGGGALKQQTTKQVDKLKKEVQKQAQDLFNGFLKKKKK